MAKSTIKEVLIELEYLKKAVTDNNTETINRIDKLETNTNRRFEKLEETLDREYMRKSDNKMTERVIQGIITLVAMVIGLLVAAIVQGQLK